MGRRGKGCKSFSARPFRRGRRGVETEPAENGREGYGGPTSTGESVGCLPRRLPSGRSPVFGVAGCYYRPCAHPCPEEPTCERRQRGSCTSVGGSALAIWALSEEELRSSSGCRQTIFTVGLLAAYELFTCSFPSGNKRLGLPVGPGTAAGAESSPVPLGGETAGLSLRLLPRMDIAPSCCLPLKRRVLI